MCYKINSDTNYRQGSIHPKAPAFMIYMRQLFMALASRPARMKAIDPSQAPARGPAPDFLGAPFSGQDPLWKENLQV